MNSIPFERKIKEYCKENGLDYSKVLDMSIVPGIDYYKIQAGNKVVLCVYGCNENHMKIEETEYTRKYLKVNGLQIIL